MLLTEAAALWCVVPFEASGSAGDLCRVTYEGGHGWMQEEGDTNFSVRRGTRMQEE